MCQNFALERKTKISYNIISIEEDICSDSAIWHKTRNWFTSPPDKADLGVKNKNLTLSDKFASVLIIEK